MMDYSKGRGELENWIVSETSFSAEALGKSEAIMVLGNGYMGLRSAAEEPYINEKRNLFINGTFNKSQANEVTELPNTADITRIDIRIDGERFSLEFGETKNYIRQLNLKTAELERMFEWVSPKGKGVRFRFRRFVSLDNLHLIGMKMEVESLTDSIDVSFDSGINAQMTNSGSQHFLEGERRIADDRFIQLVQTTSESGIDVVLNTVHKTAINGEQVLAHADKDMDRRRVWLTHDYRLQPGDKLEMEKLATVHTSRDKKTDEEHHDLDLLRERSLRELRQNADKGYNALFLAHKQAWQEQVWNTYNVEVESDDGFDQLALRFSLYQLTAMNPAHDDRMGIGAKALSGEGYKGHSFWDTEIFILPFFIFSNPTAAKSLLTYRYRGLPGARRKAAENGYAGAMYPWEMAWPTDGEVTPVWGDIDIVTGDQTKIWSGFIEQHISADIAFAVYQYENVTGDQAFMEQCGYEMVFGTADFWASRLEWNETRQKYVITDVIGPDEYKEHVSNNAYTNYMAYFNLRLAARYYEKLKQENPDLLLKFEVVDADREWQAKADLLYLPEPRGEDKVIPQDDTYLQLPEVDLTKYKKQTKVRTIYRDYNPEQINGFQVTKQADVLLLLYLLEQTFLQSDDRLSKAVKRASFDYYEPRTLHDSSLSLATHVIVANDLGEKELAYSLFRKACEIDLGPQMDTSDSGVHAASIGGIWKSAVFGFAGLRVADGLLRIDPQLPEKWHRMQLSIFWRGQALTLEITEQTLKVTARDGGKVSFETGGVRREAEGTVEVRFNADRPHVPSPVR